MQDVAPDAVLVTGLRMGQRKSKDGEYPAREWVLMFELHQRPELRLSVGDRTLHALVNGLLQREAAAGWALPPLPVCEALAPEVKPTLQ